MTEYLREPPDTNHVHVVDVFWDFLKVSRYIIGKTCMKRMFQSLFDDNDFVIKY